VRYLRKLCENCSCDQTDGWSFGVYILGLEINPKRRLSADDHLTVRTMAQESDGYEAVMRWHPDSRPVEGDMDSERSVDDHQLAMAVEDGKINAIMGGVGNDQAYMFISDTSDLQPLGDGIFGSESLNDGVAAAEEQQNSEVHTSETDVQTFEYSVDPNDSGTGQQEGPAVDTAQQSGSTMTVGSENLDNSHPLGSSENPIRIVQQGNKYTSMQELSPGQLNQIMQVCNVPYYYYLL